MITKYKINDHKIAYYFCAFIIAIFFIFYIVGLTYGESNDSNNVLDKEKSHTFIENFEMTKLLVIEKEIQNVIKNQIIAFKNSNCEKAYNYASISIKFFFPKQNTFCEMVKNYYPMIWNPKEFIFLKPKIINGIIVQSVKFIDINNDTHVFQYQMRKNENLWKINGVFKD